MIVDRLPITRDIAARTRFWGSGDYLKGLPVSIPNDILRLLPNIGPKQSAVDTAYGYLSTERGFLVNSENPSEFLEFQFNPTELQWMKDNEFATNTYNGVAAIDTFFVNGGARKLNFQLTFDFTIGALQITEYYKRIYKGLVVDVTSKEGLHNFQNTIDSNAGLAGVGMPFHILRGFQYPNQDRGGVKFSVDGQYVLSKQFNSFPFIHFSYGPYYLGCTLTSLTTRDTLFSKALNPIKGVADIELTINEFSII